MVADLAGYDPEKDSDAGKLLQIADIVTSFGALGALHSAPGKVRGVIENIKSINDLKELSQKVSAKIASSDEIAALEAITDSMDKIKLQDIKEGAKKIDGGEEIVKDIDKSQSSIGLTPEEVDEVELLTHKDETGRATKEDKLRLTELKDKQNAIQKSSTSGVFQHPQEGVGETGSERGGVESSIEGDESPKRKRKSQSKKKMKVKLP